MAAASAMIGFAALPFVGVALVASLVFGCAWILTLALLNASAQLVLPDWVRARGMALLLTCFFGSLAIGSAIWGQVAAWLDIREALLLAGGLCLLLQLGIHRLPVVEEASDDLQPAALSPPSSDSSIPPGQGPILVTIEYQVPVERIEAFVEALCELPYSRRRLGARAWRFFEDAAEPGRFIETWREPSWAAHLRHHERMSVGDLALRERVQALADQEHRPPRVTHWTPPRRGWQRQLPTLDTDPSA